MHWRSIFFYFPCNFPNYCQKIIFTQQQFFVVFESMFCCNSVKNHHVDLNFHRTLILVISRWGTIFNIFWRLSSYLHLFKIFILFYVKKICQGSHKFSTIWLMVHYKLFLWLYKISNIRKHNFFFIIIWSQILTKIIIIIAFRVLFFDFYIFIYQNIFKWTSFKIVFH